MHLLMSIISSLSVLGNVVVLLFGAHRAFLQGVKKPKAAHCTLAIIVCSFQFAHVTGDLFCPVYWFWLMVEPVVYYWLISLYLRPVNDDSQLQKKAVLITGCDSGFGNALARRLDLLGVRVYACCLLADGGKGSEDLTTDCSTRLKVLHLDVTNQDMIDSCRQRVEESLQDDEVFWGLLNNAGMNMPAELELTSMEDIHKQMDVNCYGQVRMCKTFLPLLRRCGGRVVNVASVVGNVGMYNLGGYCMSKFAVEAFSSVLRQEMLKWGVHVATVEPGPYATSIGSDGISQQYVEELWGNCSEEVKAAYGKEYFDAYPSAPEFCLERDLSPVLEGMEDALFSPDPLCHYTMGSGCFYMPFMDKCCQYVLHRWEWLLKKNTIYPGAIPTALKKAKSCD